jgi:colanic acid biosynthesis glycosyl transferase WcaI
VVNVQSGARKSRIIYVSQLFDPEPTFKGLRYAQELASQGFHIEVVTGFPNYPGGKLYEGYNVRAIAREQIGKLHVTRLAIYPYHGKSAFKRALAYLSFSISAAIYLLYYAQKNDIIYVFYPALTAGYSALLAKVFRGSKVVIDVQDIWPDSLEATGMIKSRLLHRILGLVCRLQYRFADHLVVLSRGFRDLLVSRGADPEKVSVIYNWAEEASAPASRAPLAYHPADRFRALFAGNMGAAQGLSTLIEAAAIVENERPDVAFYFMGSGIEVGALRAQAEACARNVSFVPRVPLEQVHSYLTEADCLMVHLRPDPLFAITIPSKTQAYLYAGRPVLMAVEGEAADLIEGAGAGLAARPGDARDIADKIIRLRDAGPQARMAMGERGRVFYDQNLSFARGVAATASLFQALRGA